MNNKVYCPHCGSGETYTKDNEPLAHYDEAKSKKDGVGYIGNIDSEVYVSARCYKCDKSFSLIGDIIWRTPK